MTFTSAPRHCSAAPIAAAFTLALVGIAVLALCPGQASAASPVAAEASGLPDMASIAARLAPAVVNISVSGTRTISTVGDAADEVEDEDFGAQDPDAMRDFLRRFQQRFGGLPPQMRMPMRAEGSGFIVRADGVILTNAHVVSDAEEVLVKLTDRREFRAKVLGADKLTDIAVLKVDADNLPVVSLATPGHLRVGEWVLAIGSPFGFESSVTVGVISATRRVLPGDGAVSFIQTDAAVNPGNSGGPLINVRGEVIGINSQIFTATGGFQGLSFAVPIEVAKRAEQDILTAGEVHHAKLGVKLQQLDQTLAESFKLDNLRGALIVDVKKGGAADRAGLQSGDIVLAIDGHPVEDIQDLSERVDTATAGDRIDMSIWRHGQSQTLHAELEDGRVRAVQNTDFEGAEPTIRLGLAVRPLQPDEKRQSGISAGLLIEHVTGAAARAGLQPGDLLLAVDGQPVNTADQANSAVGGSAKSAALLIQRSGQRIYVPVRLI